ncbi:glucose-1-phosphate thymidylyltransferase, partial [Francisella tularensis]|nr:glucose-1-phosphate thymidylyltransferase [Francisella tularensis]
LKIQLFPDVFSHAFMLGDEYLACDSAILILVDNIYCGKCMTTMLESSSAHV